MERKGGCCLAPRYGAAAAGQQQAGAAWQMGRIMLKFRPIAPKPAAMAPVPTPAPVPAAGAGAGRGKRKAVGGGGRRGRKPKRAATVAPVVAAPAPAVAGQAAAGDCRKDKDCEKEKSLSSRSSSSSGMTSVDSSPPPPPQQARQPATLPLMPVSLVEEKPAVAAATGEPAPVASMAPASAAGAQPVPPRPALGPAAAASSWVTVEEVTATWRHGEEAPSSAAAEAPAFVSDQWGRVTWTNAAFARAVSADGDEEARAVGLAGALPAWGTCAGFTCRVRVVRHASSDTPRRGVGGGSSVVAPCDVWRLDAGGCYLWRLDLQAALTLGGLP
ncbi:hypothetical protein GQ55_3G064400 [Panicum hallii var. hallii]|uniref:DUF7950 domain-containing protein n=1 Tax=Panicum hallii var. hallii TaxID=1504633 RepID=A0A2T7E6D9_9POAL|nr:hypothetical protein GQ55_3G064400 [Panicum hallii var. hallii]